MTANTFFARQSDKRMGEDVRANLVRLFSERSAQIVENDASEYDAPRYFDYAVATVGTPDLDLRLVRVRGEFSIDISIPGHRRWDALNSALLWLDMQRGVKTKSEIPSWGYGCDWASLGGGTVKVFLGNGDGTFNLPATFGAGSFPYAIAAGDFNLDGKVDLVVTNDSGDNVSVLLGNGDGTFQTAVNYPVGFEPEFVVLGDFNGDGIPDLVVANFSSFYISLLLGNGDGTFQAATSLTPVAIQSRLSWEISTAMECPIWQWPTMKAIM